MVLEDLACTKQIDKASPIIARAVCNGKVFRKVEIHVTASCTGSSRETYFAYKLKNVQVARYVLSGSGQSEQVPVEDFRLNFEEITVTYTENDTTGSTRGNVEFSWDVEGGHL